MALAELAGVAKIAAVGLVSVGIGAGVYFVAEEGISDGPVEAPLQVVATQPPPTPEPLSPPEQVGHPPTAAPPPALDTPSLPPERVERCPDGWQLFDNTVLHYSVCYPPDWGIQSQQSADAVATLAREEMTNQITIAGPGFFPAEPGGTTIDALPPDVRARVEAAPRILLNYVGPEIRFEACTPDADAAISGVDALWCEDVFSIPAHERTEYRPDGDWHMIKVLVPLLTPEDFDGRDRTGLRLTVATVSLRSVQAQRVDLFWQIIRSAEVY